MSAFLGPIHFWLYRKIELQEKLVQDLLQFAEDHQISLRTEIDQTYGTFPTQPMEEIIDESNIHGWLQEKVSLVEVRLAAVVTELLARNPELWDGIKATAYQFGESLPVDLGSPVQMNPNAASDTLPTTPSECFQALSNVLVDGMPCDRALSIRMEDGNKIEWVRNVCVHSSYWNHVNGNSENYYVLRDEITRGFLAKTEFHYTPFTEETSVYCISR